jgi:hypothetical protein
MEPKVSALRHDAKKGRIRKAESETLPPLPRQSRRIYVGGAAQMTPTNDASKEHP